MKQLTIEYTGSLKRKATACLHYAPDHQKLIVFCHGFKSFMDWGHFEAIGDYFGGHGFNFLRFNYTHNGTTPSSPIDFSDLEAFGENNFEKELFDTKAVIREATKHLTIKPSIFLMGHSKGGATALAYALENPEVLSCATLAGVLNPVAHYGDVSDLKWKKEGVKYILNGRTNQQMPLYFQFPTNTLAIQDRLNLVGLLEKDDRRFLVVHGLEDATIPFSVTHSVQHLKHVKVIGVADANHTFGGQHPYLEKELPAPTGAALDHILAFFNEMD